MKWQERQNDEGHWENGCETVGLYPPEQQGTQASDVGPNSLWLTCQHNSTSMQTITASRIDIAFINLYNTEQQTPLPMIFIFIFSYNGFVYCKAYLFLACQISMV